MGFAGLSIAISGLSANQRALDVTAHNIANADNPDYVRQRALQKNSYYDTIGYGALGKLQVGTGVDSESVSQIRSQFLDNKYRNEVVRSGYYQGLQTTYEAMESIFSEISNNGLQQTTDDFWSTMSTFTNNADSSYARGQVLSKAMGYAQTVNEIATSLSKLRTDTNKQIISSVADINEAVKTVAQMNKLIMQAQASNENANDYIDTRNKCIDKLASSLGVQITSPNNNGMVNVLVNGNPIVNGTDYDQIDVKMYNNLDPDKVGLAKLVWHRTGSDFIPDAEKGELRSLLDARDEIIPDYKDRLNTMVQKMARDINSIHRLGYGVGPSNAVTGLDFFVGSGSDDSDLTIDNIQVNSTIVKDVNKIAASKSSDQDDHERMAEILALKDTNVYMFKSITSAPITSATIQAGKDKFTLCFDNHEYKVTLNSGNAYFTPPAAFPLPQTYSIPADWANLKSMLTNSFQVNVRDENNNPVDLTTSGVSLNFDDTNHTITLGLSDATKETISIDDPTGCLSQFGISANVKYGDFYRNTVSDMGKAAETATTVVTSQQTVINELDGKRKALSNVSKDEEMANMLQFQHAYDASARVVNAIDEMLDIIINKMGRG